ncbi:hypothetical protein KC725_02525 [Candidatus Peregrinibacteria bacterium]|nr:hypothetical protein [Candidatus Peregrinibacteria bacterium]
MQNAPTFQKSSLGPRRNMINLDDWPKVMQIFQEGRYRDTFMAILNYINAEQVKKYGNEDQTHFEFRHGSTVLSVDVNDKDYTIRAPFLKLAGDKLVPFLRQVTELNFNTLVLARLVLEDDILTFRFASPIDGSFPYKVYDLFKNICHTADNFDDFFIDKFGVEHAQELKVEHYTDAEVDAFYEQFQSILKEAMEFVDYFEGRRLYTFGKEILILELQKLDYSLRPQGFLKGEIEKVIKGLKAQAPDDQKLMDQKPEVVKLQEMAKEKFAQSMYKVEVFVPEGGKMDVMGVKNYFKKTVEDAEKDLERRAYEGAYLILAGDIYSLLFYNDLPEDIYKMLVELLEKASGKPWSEADTVLLEGLQNLMK